MDNGLNKNNHSHNGIMIYRPVPQWMRKFRFMDACVYLNSAVKKAGEGRRFTFQAEVTTPRVHTNKGSQSWYSRVGLFICISSSCARSPVLIRFSCCGKQKPCFVLTCQKRESVRAFKCWFLQTASGFVLEVWSDCPGVLRVTQVIMGSQDKAFQ